MNSLQKSVFKIVLDNYYREKVDLKIQERNRLIQTVYVDCADIPTDLADSITAFLRETNVREREYHKETEFILDFATDVNKV